MYFYAECVSVLARVYACVCMHVCVRVYYVYTPVWKSIFADC